MRDYNNLLADFKTLGKAQDDLRSDFDTLRWQKLELQRERDAFDTCLRYASTLEVAKSCLP